MRWIWIDRIIEHAPGERLVAVKNISLAEDHLHHAQHGQPALPASLLIEGMAQTAGILLSLATDFREKVILAKIGKAEIAADPAPGCVVRHTAEIASLSSRGASIRGTIDCADPRDPARFEPIGSIEMVLSFLERNLAGVEYPEHNFVLNELFDTLLATSGIPLPDHLDAHRAAHLANRIARVSPT